VGVLVDLYLGDKLTLDSSGAGLPAQLSKLWKREYGLEIRDSQCLI
jgi:hypothetical protein